MTEIPPVEVTIHITAAPEDVFPYFTDPARYVQWMAAKAKLGPEPGGVYRAHVRRVQGGRDIFPRRPVRCPGGGPCWRSPCRASVRRGD